MGLATCSITFLLFFWKKHYLKDANDFWSQTLITVIFASMNAVQIKLMNILYTFLAKKLNEWENYQKDYQKTRDLTIKLIIFEFINAYFSIFYIGFVKPNINNDPNSIHRGILKIYQVTEGEGGTKVKTLKKTINLTQNKKSSSGGGSGGGGRRGKAGCCSP